MTSSGPTTLPSDFDIFFADFVEDQPMRQHGAVGRLPADATDVISDT